MEINARRKIRKITGIAMIANIDNFDPGAGLLLLFSENLITPKTTAVSANPPIYMLRKILNRKRVMLPSESGRSPPPKLSETYSAAVNLSPRTALKTLETIRDPKINGRRIPKILAS